MCRYDPFPLSPPQKYQADGSTLPLQPSLLNRRSSILPWSRSATAPYSDSPSFSNSAYSTSIEWHTDHVILYIHKSKANKQGPGEDVFLLHSYWTRFQLETLPPHSRLFPSIRQSHIQFGTTKTGKKGFTRFLRDRLRQLQVPTPLAYIGHSLRPGGATDLARAGASMATIQAFDSHPKSWERKLSRRSL